ncbi:hypothetical protein JN531_001340 [Flagellatimonas centrodinii]|uniref:hypothetical protein n=1 Tax=Flagellatimonas centrodinii TaxID=2806210 RepID=UPI001FF05A82|nr:hypothetical protein [Flagellatimonas centrodinii]ULQ46942.1 hypothetical protein JN531_001340 [Flagellatimonas centrodinii]
MDKLDAVVLDNWFPTPNQIEVRGGWVEHATGLPAAVESLLPYNSPTASELFAVSDGGIYDVTTAGAVGSAEVSSLSNSRFQHVNFGTAGGNFLIAVNGEDVPQYYNGSSWSTLAITDSNPTDIGDTLIHVNAYKSRLFFTQADSLSFWYLAPLAIQGVASEFELDSIARRGGYLVAMATWSLDGGQGPDDYAVFLTSNGEVIVYTGTDPGSASTWSLVGVYRSARPIGRRCFMEYGGDLLILTEEGVYPLSKALITGRTSPRIAISDKIAPSFESAARETGSQFGWDCILYPRGGYGLFNVPNMGTAFADQYVFNTTTSAWCRFKNQPARCWALSDENLYFGANGVVCLADADTTDDGEQIIADVLPAFQYMAGAGQKRWTMSRPVFFSSGPFSPSYRLNVDWELTSPNSTPSSAPAQLAQWNVAPWNTSFWSASNTVFKDWITVSEIGYSASLRIRVAKNGQAISLVSIDYLYEAGGVL